MGGEGNVHVGKERLDYVRVHREGMDLEKGMRRETEYLILHQRMN